MNTTLHSLALRGMEADIIRIEVDQSPGQPGMTIVGLGDKAVMESKERIRSSLRNSGFSFPRGKVVVNLGPAHIPKRGPFFDLAIALGILSLQDDKLRESFHEGLFVGELTLDGRLTSLPGVLSLSLSAQKMGYNSIYVPAANVQEASQLTDMSVYGVSSLRELYDALTLDLPLQLASDHTQKTVTGNEQKLTLDDIRGHEAAKRAVMISAAGGHNLLLSGPPGAGKSLLAKALQSLLPPLSMEESLEVTQIQSLAAQLPTGVSVVSERPFRSIHHSASAVSLVGGGRFPRPGEISLAHRGVLFLDELTEFPRKVLEVLRQPLEDKEIQISRTEQSVSYPANVIFVGAMNPCPCGYGGQARSGRICSCTPAVIERYQRRVSGPLLDRIDLHCQVEALSFDELGTVEQSTAREVERSVRLARDLQRERYGDASTLNAHQRLSELLELNPLDEAATTVSRNICQKFRLSGRGYAKLLAVARTIADLEALPQIQEHHLLEASQYCRR